MKMINDNCRDQKGFSTTELLLASAMAVLVVGVGGVTLSNVKKSESRATMSTFMLQEHTLNMQKSRSADYIKSMVSSEDGQLNPNIAACFSGRAVAGGCQQFDGDQSVSAWISDEDCVGRGCDMKSQIRLEFECNTDRCTQVKAHVSSWAEDESWGLRALSATTRLPASIFAAENSVNYSCMGEMSNGVAIFGVDQNVASCSGPAIPTACTGGRPLRAVASVIPGSQDSRSLPTGGRSTGGSRLSSGDREQSGSTPSPGSQYASLCHTMANASCGGNSGVRAFRMIASGSASSSDCRF